MKTRFAATILLTAALACGDSSGPDVPSATGTWRAFVDTQTEMELTLVEARDGSLSGTGRIYTAQISVSFDVVGGQHAHPTISVLIDIDGDPTLGVGEFTSDNTFTLNEPGAVGQPLVFTRRGTP